MLLSYIIQGEHLMHLGLAVLFVGLAFVVLFLMGRWLLTKFGAPAIALTLWMALFVIFGGLFLISLLFDLAGHPLVEW